MDRTNRRWKGVAVWRGSWCRLAFAPAYEEAIRQRNKHARTANDGTFCRMAGGCSSGKRKMQEQKAQQEVERGGKGGKEPRKETKRNEKEPPKTSLASAAPGCCPPSAASNPNGQGCVDPLESCHNDARPPLTTTPAAAPQPANARPRQRRPAPRSRHCSALSRLA